MDSKDINTRTSPKTARAHLIPQEPSSPTEAFIYNECQKNHAAGIGGYALDGCGEFMPSNSDGLICAACGCHRSFHRRETQAPTSGDQSGQETMSPTPISIRFPASAVISYGVAGAMQERKSESFQQQERKKRFRTKFSLEQKERMREFAEEAEWKLRKVDVNKMEKFCGEVGVKKTIFKIWMHNNNKLTNLAKKTTDLNGNGNAEGDVGNNGCIGGVDASSTDGDKKSSDPSSNGTDE